MGARVVNMSLGGAPYSGDVDAALTELVAEEDILLVAAAGNYGDSSYLYPASYPSVISVGATDSNDEHAAFSQYNDQVDVSAPGVQILSTLDTDVGYKSGTSMASPHVAGLVALLWNKFPGCTGSEIREALEEGAIDHGTPGRDDFYGHGIMNYHRSVNYLTNVKPCGSQGEASQHWGVCGSSRLCLLQAEKP